MVTADPITAEEEAALRGGTPHLKPVGPLPETAALLACSMLYSPTALILTVAQNIDITDLDQPAATILSTIVELAREGTVSPALVLDELRRHGRADRRTAAWLANAAVAGAPPESARRYAAVVVSESLRRHTESLGTAMRSAASTASESELRHLVETGSQRIKNITNRLSTLRGEDLD